MREEVGGNSDTKWREVPVQERWPQGEAMIPILLRSRAAELEQRGEQTPLAYAHPPPRNFPTGEGNSDLNTQEESLANKPCPQVFPRKQVGASLVI